MQFGLRAARDRLERIHHAYLGIVAMSGKTSAEISAQSEAHAKAKYESVALVMASAQRLGLNKLGIVGSEQFVN